MRARFMEAVVYLHPEVNWSGSPSTRPVRLRDDGAGPFVEFWGLAGSPLTDAEVDSAMVAKDAAVSAETARVAGIVGDVDGADLLSQLKTKTNAQIDTYVDNNITLTAATLAALRTEMETKLRAITKRELKVLAQLARSL